MYLTLNEIKKHLNIDNNFTDDDAYLLTLGEAAEKAVEKHIDTPLSNYAEDGLDGALKIAVLTLIATWYANRESVSFGNPVKLPHGYEYILNLYQSYFNSEVEHDSR